MKKPQWELERFRHASEYRYRIGSPGLQQGKGVQLWQLGGGKDGFRSGKCLIEADLVGVVGRAEEEGLFWVQALRSDELGDELSDTLVGEAVEPEVQKS